jgi:hypothetical protein
VTSAGGRNVIKRAGEIFPVCSHDYPPMLQEWINSTVQSGRNTEAAAAGGRTDAKYFCHRRLLRKRLVLSARSRREAGREKAALSGTGGTVSAPIAGAS